MVCGADAVGSTSSTRTSTDLEIGCMVDLATGLICFTANGHELPTIYQVLGPEHHVVVCLCVLYD